MHRFGEQQKNGKKIGGKFMNAIEGQKQLSPITYPHREVMDAIEASKGSNTS